MKEYLKDTKFLSMLDEMRIKKHYIKLTVLSFKDEKPLREVQGIATAGSITVNGASNVRRTISLTLSATGNENDISNIDNIISLNKKVKVEVGLENPFPEYAEYGDIIWFDAGVYVINQATTSTSASSANISISGKDKMCLLDGTCGGTLPASVSFHETQYENDAGDIVVEDIPIFTIIKECVSHYGKEPEQNIFINDVDMTAKLSTKYIGQDPIWFTNDYQSFVISETPPADESYLQHKFVYGQDVGYQETDFTYPGELVFSAGDTVSAVLDKIIEQLGNYEYFYDLNGNFIFQEKKNYLNHYYTPITQVNDNYYIKAFSDSKYYYTFIDAKDALSYYNSPKYENIKNDFIVWGEKTTSDGATKTIQYHMAIDEKPQIDLAGQYMWDVSNGRQEHSYYLFEYDKSNYDQQPVQKPIEITYDMEADERSAEQIEADARADVENNVLKNYNFQEDDKFILYYKIIFSNQVQYSKVVIGNSAILEYKALDDLTDKVDYSYLAFGIYPKGNTTEENPSYYLLEQRLIDNKQVLGFYDKDGQWTDVYTILDTLSISNINNFIKEVSSKYYLKIIKDIKFDEVNKDYDTSFVQSNQKTVASITAVPSYKLISYNADKEYTQYIYLMPDFAEIKDTDENVIMTAEEHRSFISGLLELYKTNKDNLTADLDTLFKADEIPSELKVLTSDQANQIFILKTKGYLQSSLIEDILKGYNSNILNFNGLKTNNKIKLITYWPEEPEFDYEDNFYFTLIGTPCQEWREELFRQALLNNENGSAKGDYDDELLAKISGDYLWRKQLFDPQNEEWHEEWVNQVDLNEGDTWDGWNPAIYIDPGLITYWLDFIDTDQLVSKYSVNQIGRRTQAMTKTNMSMLYKLEVPDIIFFENTGDEAELNKKIEQYQLEGQAYCALKPSQMKMFSSSGTGSTAFDYIREMLYTYLMMNLTITINCTPRYYLEPNNLIYIDDKNSKIKGEFVITQYTLPLAYNGNMSITTNEVLTRV